jgi:hypothetical protein
MRTKQIAQLLRGISIGEILKVADEIPAIRMQKHVIHQLKRKVIYAESSVIVMML